MTDLPEERRLLAERARELAAPRATPPVRAPLALIECRLGPERYALRLDQVRELATAERLVSIPCTPPHLAGMMNLRGTILPVLDLGPVLGLSPAPPEGGGIVVVVAWGASLCGLRFDATMGVRALDPDELLPPPAAENGYLEGATRDGLLLLALAALMADEGLVVAEEPPGAPLFRTDIPQDRTESTPRR